MPWESRTVMNQREQFVEEAAESRNFSDLCRRYGISRKTGYKWVQRAQAGAPLEDQSRRPGHPFGQTPAEVEEKILAVRSDNPAWGGLKIKAELERRGETGIPSARTCGAIRNAMAVSRRKSLRSTNRISALNGTAAMPCGRQTSKATFCWGIPVGVSHWTSWTTAPGFVSEQNQNLPQAA